MRRSPLARCLPTQPGSLFPSSGSSELEYRSLPFSFRRASSFRASSGRNSSQRAASLIYVGAIVLAVAAVSLGIGLVRAV